MQVGTIRVPVRNKQFIEREAKRLLDEYVRRLRRCPCRSLLGMQSLQRVHTPHLAVSAAFETHTAALLV